MGDDADQELLPLALVKELLQQGLGEDRGTRVTKQAVEMSQALLELFAREALARARSLAATEEVPLNSQHLGRIIPQLMLDFGM